jgi:hypothetical protein
MMVIMNALDEEYEDALPTARHTREHIRAEIGWASTNALCTRRCTRFRWQAGVYARRL